MQHRGVTSSLGASFAQVNAPVAARMQEYVLARVMSHEPASVIDGYSGAGELALALASRGIQVCAVELDADASAYAAARLPAGSRAVAAKMEDALASLLPA